MQTFINLCKAIVGNEHVLTSEVEQKSYLEDWRQRVVGKALAIVRPSNTEQVAALVQLCQDHHVPIVPQGGNTGLVFGSIPDQSGTAIVLSLKRLQGIRKIDLDNHTMTVEAGCLLAQVQEAANEVGLLFPLSLASEGSCTIGGNLSTNAGGTAVLRYGNTRELCLGLEVVTAQGEIWNGLRELRKDNTGYDLRDLFIGAEGTLGIITACVLKLFPKPTQTQTVFTSLDSIEQAVALLETGKKQLGASLTGFELINQISLELVHHYFPQLQRIFSETSAWYVLLEVTNHGTVYDLDHQLEQVCATALEQDIILNASIAKTEKQAKNCWAIRESISAAQAKAGKNIKHDISLPISQIANFVKTTDAILQTAYPGCRMVTFGHLGDGNLHYNVSSPVHKDPEQFLEHQKIVNQIVHDQTMQHAGSISAEHGIGELKKAELRRYKSKVEMQLMRAIKNALDPQNLMNPGKILE
ncbi:FAD-binding oxidoreductase [Undibacterium fentianense]|uniref:FAD-binding oxidoreductase n=1 Tax=Undibacterium fentianense TaxID=2828728 RepID=A0A941E4M6_9BURK|nr:FAD-binding oxidoreductase [Undibacterium fentianense]MBR7798713.1 FAD-binding oxidoreductase [Undibacterium fentianense]